MDSVECIVVGAGVVGLAVARELALAGREVVVLEQAEGIGTETSSRNSEVIHAGIYYPKDSLKALTCVAGKAMLYDYCAAHGVPHRRLGKLIVATGADQGAGLEAIRAKAAANGVGDLEHLTRAEAQALEPQLSCTEALLSPSTGIIDSHAYMLALQGDAEAAGAMFAFHTPVTRIVLESDGFVVETGGAAPMRLKAGLLVNAAGLHAPGLAAAMEGFPAGKRPGSWLAKGNYYALSVKSPFSRLIYPMPEPGGLGVHITLDLAGQARFGPDVEWVDHIDYTVDPARSQKFYAAVRRYWPGLPDGAIQPAYSGIRPKIAPPGENPDFRIDGPAEHGIAGLVQLFGIESPGLTASLAIAERVAEKLT
jgi:L-2-hydroxyglutarate oxidase LhgO